MRELLKEPIHFLISYQEEKDDQERALFAQRVLINWYSGTDIREGYATLCNPFRYWNKQDQKAMLDAIVLDSNPDIRLMVLYSSYISEFPYLLDILTEDPEEWVAEKALEVKRLNGLR